MTDDPKPLSPEDQLRAACVVLRLGGAPDLPLRSTLKSLATVAGALCDQNPGLKISMSTDDRRNVTISVTMNGYFLSSQSDRGASPTE